MLLMNTRKTLMSENIYGLLRLAGLLGEGQPRSSTRPRPPLRTERNWDRDLCIYRGTHLGQRGSHKYKKPIGKKMHLPHEMEHPLKNGPMAKTQRQQVFYKKNGRWILKYQVNCSLVCRQTVAVFKFSLLLITCRRLRIKHGFRQSLS